MAGEAPGAISAAREKKKEEKSLKNNDVLDFLRNLQNRVGMVPGPSNHHFKCFWVSGKVPKSVLVAIKKYDSWAFRGEGFSFD